MFRALNTLSLNPYSTGRYSVSINETTKKAEINIVLILILLEDTL